MRSVAFWGACALLVIGALSAAIAMGTVEWLYPQLATRPARFPGAGQPAAIGPEAGLAAELIRRAGSGQTAAAAALAPSIPEEALRFQVTRVRAAPLRAAPLPGPEHGPVKVLVWAEYRREGEPLRGAYVVTVTGETVTEVTGPVTPEGGYPPLSLRAWDEQGRPVDWDRLQGRALVLVAPRRPTPGLGATLADLHARFRPYGVEVVLILDLGAPDWTVQARVAGFQGAVWRVKDYLEQTPVVNPGRFEGAVGLLVDREGYVVSSLAALDPSRYGVAEQPAPEVATAVFRAYGLLP